MIVFVALQHGSALRRIDALAGPFLLHISPCLLQYFNVGSNNNIKKNIDISIHCCCSAKIGFCFRYERAYLG